MDTSKIVGEKIKSLRESKNISREELAERSGLAIEQIERIENNIDLPSLAPLIKIARVLGVRLGTFLDDQDEMGPAICRKSEAILSSHEGEEFIMVMQGTMEICYGKNTYLLEEGDSIYYDSIVPHHVHAYQGQAAKILAVIYTPV